MLFTKVFSNGNVLNHSVYEQLKVLDTTNINFKGCGNEFYNNRDWWVILNKKNKIIAYCGSIYSEGICIFNRAWVSKENRGKKIHIRMIRLRINAAKKICSTVITYTTRDNYPSANNLITCGFKLYNPTYQYAGGNMLYFQKPF